MGTAYLAIPLLAEVFLLLTIGSPLALVGRLRRRPQLAIRLWLICFSLAVLCALLLAGIFLVALVEAYEKMNATPFGSEHWASAFALSFVPWILLAIGGISLAKFNQMVEPFIVLARETRHLLDLAGTPSVIKSGVKVLELNLKVPYAAVVNYRHRATILITTGTIEALDAHELSAVLEHELAHVRLKHLTAKRLATFACALAPRLATGRLMQQEIDTLCELAADSACLGKFHAQTLAKAREKLSEAI